MLKTSFCIKSFAACCLALLCLGVPAAHAANAVPPRTLRFEQVTAAQGLASDSVLAMAQDSQGFMWFGGQSGLTRYDGYNAVSYKSVPADPHSLASSSVWIAYVDEQGRLWVGTRQGLHLYDRQHDNFIRYRPSNANAQDSGSLDVRHIVGDGHGGLWLATTRGLQHFDPATGQFSIIRHKAGEPDSLANNRVSTLALDRHGRLWVGTGSGVDCLSPGSSAFKHYRLDDPAKPDNKYGAVVSLVIDHEGTLWVGTGGANGLEAWQVDGETPKRRKFGAAENLHINAVFAMYEDKQNNLWLSEFRGGLIHWDPATNRFVTYRHNANDPHSLADDSVVSLFQDRSGTLWVGTWGSWASKVDLAYTGFMRYIHNQGSEKSPVSDKISHIAKASDGRLWLGTSDGGLRLWDPDTGEETDFRHNPKDTNSLSDDYVRGVAVDSKGELWTATAEGLSRFDAATQHWVRHLPSVGEPAGLAVTNIAFDRSDMLWALSAAGAGLSRFDPVHGTWQNYRHKEGDPNSLINDNTFALIEDREGTVWVGSSVGLERLDRASGRFTHFDVLPKEAANLNGTEVWTLFEDSLGRIWAGTTNGLSLMEKGAGGAVRFHTYPTPAAVDSILEDGLGRIWVSTDAGISCFDPVTGAFKHYSSHDDSIEHSYFNASGAAGADGRLYFGGANGLTAFLPREIRDNPVAPQVLVTDLQIFNKSIRVGTEFGAEKQVLPSQIQDTRALTLSYKDSVFSLEFAALHFADPQRNKFAYRLEGFDKDWAYTDANRRIATYTNLDPGRYAFHVKAANKDGVWNDDGASIDITITPPYWKTWWFRALVAALLIGSAVAAYRSRVRGLIRQKTVLEEQVGIRTAEVVRQKGLIQERNAELEEANSALALARKIQDEQQSELTRFLAVASHDLRQPMHALNIYLEALFNVELPNAAKPFLLNVRKCAHVMDEMFMALLDLSRLDAHVVEPHIRPFPIAAVLSRLDVEFTPQAALKGLGLSISTCDQCVESDAGLVEQILRNLLANAVRYTNRGSIKVSCAIVQHRLHVAVRDTGIGISPDQQKTVFEEFCQIGTMGRDKGLGLGLAIVKRLSKLLDAPINLASVPGEGSTFTLDLPVAEQHAEAIVLPAPTPSPDQRQLYGKLIVVVDDEENIQDAMRSLLEQWGCVVVTAASYVEARKKLDVLGRTPDFLISDYRLRQSENGLQVIEALQADFGEGLPAILITGDTSPAVIQDIQSSGVLTLHKPVEAGSLIGLLMQILE